MINLDLGFRVKELANMVNLLKSEINELRAQILEDRLWDNSDMIQNWKVSKRTLAMWRSEGMIDFVQMGSKIWYTKENRESFLAKNAVKATQ